MNQNPQDNRRLMPSTTGRNPSFEQYYRAMLEDMFSSFGRQQFGPGHGMLEPYSAGFGREQDQFVNDNERFMVSIDVRQYRPEDLRVSVRDNILTIEGNHEERPDQNGIIRQQFVRSYGLPDDLLQDTLASHLDNGILTVTARKRDQPAQQGSSRPIPIDRSGSEPSTSRSSRRSTSSRGSQTQQ